MNKRRQDSAKGNSGILIDMARAGARLIDALADFIATLAAGVLVGCVKAFDWLFPECWRDVSRSSSRNGFTFWLRRGRIVVKAALGFTLAAIAFVGVAFALDWLGVLT